MDKAGISRLLKSTEDYCAERGLRFTEPRRYALEIIASAKKPVGAYDVLAGLAKKIPNPKPPTAYRAIEFLAGQGFIHRIESLNAYVLCHAGHQHQGSQFLICDVCGKVIEAHLCHLPGGLQERAHKEGFRTARWNVELHGVCRACAGNPANEGKVG